MEPTTPTTKNERVWDPLVRLFHWSLVAAFATAWWGRGEASIHETAGKIVLALVIFRIAWGIIGTGAARFETFVHGPRATLAYVASILRGRPAHHASHNPAGAAMVLMLLSAVAATAASGILMSTTRLWGNSTVEYIHGTAANVVLMLIAGHLLGVLLASYQHHENLIFSMLTGWKRVTMGVEPYLGTVAWTWRRLLLASLTVLAAVGLWQASTSALNASFWRMDKIIAAAVKENGCVIKQLSPPELLAYPSLELRYTALIEGHTGKVLVAVPGREAAQARPALSFPEIVEACQAVHSATVSMPSAERSASAASANPDKKPDLPLAGITPPKPAQQAESESARMSFSPAVLSAARRAAAMVSANAAAEEALETAGGQPPAVTLDGISVNQPTQTENRTVRKATHPGRVQSLKSGKPDRQKRKRKRKGRHHGGLSMPVSRHKAAYSSLGDGSARQNGSERFAAPIAGKTSDSGSDSSGSGNSNSGSGNSDKGGGSN